MRKIKTEKEIEAEFQSDLIKELRTVYGYQHVLKIPASVLQGVSDVQVTHGPKYARLECKAYEDAKHQPNQDYYVDDINNQGGFARFIWPENKDHVLEEMADFFNK